MATEANNTNYWISSSALYIQLNAMGEPDYIQCSVVSGASILCYMQGIPGLEYDAGHNYQRWPLAAYPSVFPNSDRKYIYVAIPRTSTAENNTAVVVYPSERIDLYGYSIATPDKLVGKEEFYYIYLQGIISEVQTDADGKTRKRDWIQHVDCGKLSTDESFSSGIDGTWWRYNSVTDSITFLKTILSATFDMLTAKIANITKLFLGGSELNGVANDLSIETDNTKVVTPQYLGQFGVKHFLAKDKDDVAHGAITFEKVQKFLGGLLVGENFSFDKEGNIIAHSISSDGASEENGKGFTILQKDPLTNTYKLCIDEVIAYTVATVGKLFVNGNSRFGGELSSKQFISGFLGGLGWGIYNTPVTNAAGVQENKWTGEFDNVIVRGSLRVFEMIISQLLGENDNRIFTGMMEVDHYDAESGRVYLNTQDGKLYNPFRRNDIIMVQQFNGMPNSSNDYYVTKNYELLITDAGCGSLEDGDKRLDWVTFTNFTSSMEGATAESLIKKKDTFVRVDNLSDSQRKGIIQLMTVGANTPYMDIIYGLKTDPNNALKGRLGNLKGIVHPILGELSGFGEFLNNLYAVGDFIIQRTGESVDSKLQVLENMFSSRFSQTSYELTNSDNYLENGQFLEQVRDDEDTIISCWAVDTTDESMFWADALGNPFMVNGLLSVSGNRKVSIDKMDGRQVLRLQNCGVKQLNAHIRQPGTHKEYQQPSGSTGDNGLKKPDTGSTDVQDRLYISIRIFAKTAGTLTVGFEGCSSVSGKSNTLTAQNVAVPYSGDWTNIPLEGVWNGTGNFVLRYTGDCYIAIASITDKPLSEFSKSVSTQIKQTATNIQLLGENINKVDGTTTQLGLDLDAEKKSIRLYVDETDKANRTFTTSGIEASVGKVQAWVKNLDYATNTTVTSKVEILSGRITSTVSKVNANSTSITNIQQDIDTITQTVGQAATKEQLKENVATLNRAIDSARSHADDVGTGIRNDYASTITLVKQSSSSWSVAAGMFSGQTLTDKGIATITPTVNSLCNSRIDDRKNEIRSGLVTTADFAALQTTVAGHTASISTSVQKDANGYITNASIKADRIKLEGLTTVNNYFKVLADGSIECVNADISGDLKVTNMRYAADIVVDGKVACSCITGEGTYVLPDLAKGEVMRVEVFRPRISRLTPPVILKATNGIFLPNSKSYMSSVEQIELYGWVQLMGTKFVDNTVWVFQSLGS